MNAFGHTSIITSGLRKSFYISLVIIVTVILVALEALTISYCGFPNSYMLPLLGLYVSFVSLLIANKRYHRSQKDVENRSGLSKIELKVLEAVRKGRSELGQIEEYLSSMGRVSRAEVFLAVVRLVKQGYLKDARGHYHLTEKTDILR
jgi:uncharacterized membrane protein